MGKLQRTPVHVSSPAMGLFKGFTLFKKSAKKSATGAAEPVAATTVGEKAVAEPVAVSPEELSQEIGASTEIAETPELAQAEPGAPSEDTLEALPEAKADDGLPAKDDVSTVAESKDGDAPANQAEP